MERETTGDKEVPEERWLPIKGWLGYDVSDRGRVRSWWGGGGQGKGHRGLGDAAKIVGGYIQKSGHAQATLYRNHSKEVRRVGVHTLVLEAFVGRRPLGHEACHNDGDPGNNCLTNLRWDSRSNNQRDTLKHGTHRQAKLKDSDIPAIWARLSEGEPAAWIGRDYGVKGTVITNIKTGKHWAHITRRLTPLPEAIRQIKKYVNPAYALRSKVAKPQPPDPVFTPAEVLAATEELWRIVPGWPAYRVSSHGRIQTRWERVRGGRKGEHRLGDTWAARHIRPDAHGYMAFWASNGTTIKTLKVHRVVLLAFAGEPPKGMVACHMDGDKTNNHVRNLRWDTPSANGQDYYRDKRAAELATAIWG